MIDNVEKLKCEIKRDGEEFSVEVSPDKQYTTVADESGASVTITYDSGNFNVRLGNGWGGWSPSMDGAVEYAVRLLFDSRTQLTADDAYKEMIEYVEKCE